MDITIRRLTPELAEEYAYFFDVTDHDDNVDENKCYCVCWCGDDCAGKDFSTAAKRREYALKYVRDGSIDGYLAYAGNEVVGWVNANAKSDCLKCLSWVRIMASVPTEEATPQVRVKSIFCYVIAPEMKRRGIATRLLERVCEDALADGYDFVEAYPNREFAGEALAFMGPLRCTKRPGFPFAAKPNGS